jgi:hypothetical protein
MNREGFIPNEFFTIIKVEEESFDLDVSNTTMLIKFNEVLSSNNNSFDKFEKKIKKKNSLESFSGTTKPTDTLKPDDKKNRKKRRSLIDFIFNSQTNKSP